MGSLSQYDLNALCNQVLALPEGMAKNELMKRLNRFGMSLSGSALHPTTLIYDSIPFEPINEPDSPFAIRGDELNKMEGSWETAILEVGNHRSIVSI